MALDQDIELLKMMTFDELKGKDNDIIIQDINNNEIIRKYFKTTDDGESFMDHVFRGFQVKGGLFNGYHSENICPNLYYEASADVNFDKSKPYKLVIDGKGENTFFPIDMELRDILLVSLLAYRDYCKKKLSNDAINVKEYNMHITICVDNDSKMFGAYPVIK